MNYLKTTETLKIAFNFLVKTKLKENETDKDNMVKTKRVPSSL